MATLEILAAFSLSFLFMLFLWNVQERLYLCARPRAAARPVLLIMDENVPTGTDQPADVPVNVPGGE